MLVLRAKTLNFEQLFFFFGGYFINPFNEFVGNFLDVSLAQSVLISVMSSLFPDLSTSH